MDEITLINGCKNSDMQARRELYELFADGMLGLCYRYMNNPDVAHDLLHDGFLRVYSAISSFTYRGEGSLKAWLTKLFTNVCLAYLRKKDLLRETVLPEDISDLPDEQETDEGTAELPIEILMGFVLDLPQGYRTVFNLYVFEEWSHKEIARELRINEHSSASQLLRARKLLARRITEYREQYG
ncbi:MAG: sigma-70 family RNA polymerase sigma factor [Tannerellaceae bacterium]|jgi:RNA polymerase sigma-70 factor (ECF subfamily)|nr:sigma-70 family RNA polymerase sigma factor [Tannerellaceae bacterium]